MQSTAGSHGEHQRHYCAGSGASAGGAFSDGEQCGSVRPTAAAADHSLTRPRHIARQALEASWDNVEAQRKDISSCLARQEGTATLSWSNLIVRCSPPARMLPRGAAQFTGSSPCVPGGFPPARRTMQLRC